MTLPGATVTTVDNAIGLSTPNVSKFQAVIGPCTGGVINTATPFSDPASMQTALTSGAAVEAAAIVLNEAGGEVLVIPVNQSVVGVLGAVTAVGSGPTVTLTGSPTDSAELQIQILGNGTLGTSTFRYSLDGGNDWSGTIATAASYAIPGAGITIGFAAGTYATTNSYSATVLGPLATSGDYATAFAVLASYKGIVPPVVHVVGLGGGSSDATKSSAMVAIAAAAESEAAALEQVGVYTTWIVEAPQVADAALITATASSAYAHTVIAAGFVDQKSVLTSRTNVRTAAWTMCSRVQSKPIGEDPKRVLTGPVPASVVAILRDESVTPGLDAARFATLRTYDARENIGFFITNMPVMSSAGSDWVYIQHRQVVNEAARLTLARLQKLIGDSPEVNDDGTIDQAYASDKEKTITRILIDALVNTKNASAVSCSILRTNNLLATGLVYAYVLVRPLGYIGNLIGTVGYSFNV